MPNINRAFSLLFTLLLLLSTMPSAQAAGGAKKDEKLLAEQQELRNNPFKIIANRIDYSHNYDFDDKNFTAGKIFNIEKVKTSRPYTTLINLHLGNALWTVRYIDKARSLIWGLPYQIAHYQALSTSVHGHNQSALLTSWTANKERGFLDFIIIPENTPMDFKIGEAAPQGDVEEYRPGGGMQLRLKYLPAGAIVLSLDLATVQKGPKGTFDLKGAFEGLINRYNAQHVGHMIPLAVADDFDLEVAAGDYQAFVKQFFTAIP